MHSSRYELTYLIPATLSDTEVTAIQQEIRAILQEHNAQPEQTDGLVRRRLAYPIKQMTHGLYVLTYFVSAPDVIEEINKILRHHRTLLRHLIASASNSSFPLPQERSMVKQKLTTIEPLQPMEQPASIAYAKTPIHIETPAEPAQTKPNATHIVPEQQEQIQDDAGSKLTLEDLDEKLEKILTSDEI